MLLGKKNKKESSEIVLKKNILLNCIEQPKDEVIRKIGGLLVESGYVKPDYVEAMIEREKTYATYMGNGIALPHGVESAKNEVRASGIAVMVFPEGTDWDGDRAKVVIGIAGKGEEHLDILGNIALKLGDEKAVDEVLSMNVEELYDFITRKEE
jgi:mannitol/fructose-specific phosphotransferase system IIA component